MTEKMKTTGFAPLLADVLLWCVLFVLTAFGATNAATMRQYSSISLRYETPLNGQTAYQARQYTVAHREETAFWATFWTEHEARFSIELRKVTADCITFSGDAALVWRAEYLAGNSPGVVDGVGCAISSGLAWVLWGDIDVVGKTIEVDGVPRIVRGVFEGAESLALVSVCDEDKTQSFAAVELSGGSPSSGRGDVESFANASGLGMPDSVLLGAPTILAEFMALLPMVILIIYGLALCIAHAKKQSVAVRRTLMFFMFLGAAALLPVFLDILPDRIIPTRWSDFAFWGSLLSNAGEHLREYLTLSPSLRDIEYAELFFKQAAIALASTGFALSICFRWQGKMNLERLKRRINCG